MSIELLEPREEEVEKYTEEDYDNMLDEVYPEVTLGSFSWSPSYVLQELDPTAYNCGFADYQEYETKYYCPICDEEFDDYDEAKFCCQTEEEDEDE